MTLDEFLRTLETLIDERESTDDDPGAGNFGCEDCRKCNHCRFCIGCDSCEDCTYCEECIDCISCTQSKRCVSCEQVSYCEDCRDCRNSRYLTLCVDCKDCVHCLACVGLEGAEFYVLNQKRTRKEYFALLRQVQELMRERMALGWRPPAIGLASEVEDPHALRSVELSAAPWLEPIGPAEAEPRRDLPARDDWAEREGPGVERRREPIREFERSRWDAADASPRSDAHPRYDAPPYYDAHPRSDASPYYDAHPRSDASRPYDAPPRSDAPRQHEEHLRSDAPRQHEEHLRSDRQYEEHRQYDEHPQRDAYRRYDAHPQYDEHSQRDEHRQYDALPHYDAPRRARAPHDELDDRRPPARAHAAHAYEFDAPRRAHEQPTQPLSAATRSLRSPNGSIAPARGREHEDWDARPLAREREWEDSHARTIARPRRDEGSGRRLGSWEMDDHDLLLAEAAPEEREREPSSPWLDEDAQAQAQRRAKRGSLRRAPRPKRKDDGEAPRESTSTASYRTGSAPPRNEGTHTSTGLRLGRKPKR